MGVAVNGWTIWGTRRSGRRWPVPFSADPGCMEVTATWRATGHHSTPDRGSIHCCSAWHRIDRLITVTSPPVHGGSGPAFMHPCVVACELAVVPSHPSLTYIGMFPPYALYPYAGGGRRWPVPLTPAVWRSPPSPPHLRARPKGCRRRRMRGRTGCAGGRATSEV